MLPSISPTPPPRSEFSQEERSIIQEHRTPVRVQRYLRALPYNWKNSLRTFRKVVEHHGANCLEAALAAATIMEQHGHPPLLLDLESVDGLDHVLFLFNVRGRWGTIGKSRDVGLHGRKPVFRTLRHLVFSYFDPYIDGSGRINGYGLINLNELTAGDWRLSERNVWAVERRLIDMSHQLLKTSDRRYERALNRFLRFKKDSPRQAIHGVQQSPPSGCSSSAWRKRFRHRRV